MCSVVALLTYMYIYRLMKRMKIKKNKIKSVVEENNNKLVYSLQNTIWFTSTFRGGQ